MPYDEGNTTPIFNSPDWRADPYDKRYECVRPECHFDLKTQQYFSPANNPNPEPLFVREGITYSYPEDWEKWNHIEAEPIIPLEHAGTIIAGEGATKLHQKYPSYGFDYSSKLGVGNPLHSWYSNTDLDLEIMKSIKNNVRKPIVEKVIEAKKLEDIFKKWSTYKAIQREFPENNITPPVEEEVTCQQVKDAINDIPLECDLINETEDLGATYSGSDMNKYWWYGWLPTEYLDNDVYDLDPDAPVAGSTFSASMGNALVRQRHFPPYQSSIGVYECIDVKEEDDFTESDPKFPFYGAFGGFTGDVCGCLDNTDGVFPKYISSCNFPEYGEKYPEYLEYVRSVDARFWNTPKITPLLRVAQKKLLFTQVLDIIVPGDLSIKVGSIIRIKLPKAAMGVEGENIEGLSVLSGKYMILSAKHTMTEANVHRTKLTIVRDSKPE